MKQTLKVKLFGNPEIYLEEQLITFPFAKINALFFYLLINKNVSRDEVAGMLWPNKTEVSAKKNLRNTIYQANKTLGQEYILSLNNQILSLNPKLKIDLDVEKFMESKANIEMYSGEFLKGFFVKDSEAYDIWMTKMRSYYEKRYSDLLYIKIDEDIEKGQTQEIERNIQKLISIDEFNERNYQLLMSYYQSKGLNSKVIEVYLKVSDLLNNELGISPSDDITNIYKTTINNVQTHSQNNIKKMPEYYYNRPYEIAVFEKRLTKFIENGQIQGVLVEGETGNGKTEFVNRILGNRQKEFNRIDVKCHPTLSQKNGHLWQTIIEKILVSFNINPTKIQENKLDMNHPNELMIEEYFINLNHILEGITQDKYLVIVVDQFECIDELSLHLINQYILTQKQHIFLVFVGNGQWSQNVTQYVSYLQQAKYLDKIIIDSLSRKETEKLVRKILIDQVVPDTLIDEIYDYSGGNLLFINELVKLIIDQKPINTLTNNMIESIEKQCYYLSEASIEVLETLSFFENGVSISLLASILNMPMIKLKREIVELLRRGLIKEDIKASGNEKIKIYKQRIKYYFYQKQSATVRHLMHAKIAETQEGQLTYNSDNIEALRQIAYHYRKSGQDIKALEFELAYLQNILRFKHELFPVYNQEVNDLQDNIELSSDEIENRFSEIRLELNAIENRFQVDRTFLTLQLNFLYIEGRYFIRLGEYDKGIENILQIIIKAKDINETDYLLRAYMQMIYYCIQINNSEDMIHYIELALDVSIYANNHESIGILLRLKGLYNIMIGKLDTAEKLINDSINTLTLNEALERKFSVNIAASYDYLAEIELIRGNYSKAIELEESALKYSQHMNAESSMIVFYINMGVCLFANKDYSSALEYLMKANELANRVSSIWKQAQLFAYLATTNALLNNSEQALKYLQKCEKVTTTEVQGRDKGVLYWAKLVLYQNGLLLNEKDGLENDKISSITSDWLTIAKDNLSPTRDVFILNYLDKNAI